MHFKVVECIIKKVNENDLEGTIFFSGFEKAFDNLDHDFMFKCLNHLNFGEDLINWIKLFYTDPQNAVLNNGYMTYFFQSTKRR